MRSYRTLKIKSMHFEGISKLEITKPDSKEFKNFPISNNNFKHRITKSYVDISMQS